MAIFNIKNGHISAEVKQRVDFALVTYMYKQANAGILTSLFCATIIVMGVRHHGNTPLLVCWYAVFVLITLLRFVLVSEYLCHTHNEKNYLLWRNLYTLGAALGGASWGFVGAFIFPFASSMQQTLCILVLSGVTAGAVPLLSVILDAAVLFLLFAIIPFIISLVTTNNPTYELFDVTLSIYLVYLINLSRKGYQNMKNIMWLRYENEKLINEMSAINMKLDSLATHDPLTLVANTNLFYNDLSKALRINDRKKTISALLFIDLDKFKEVNDTHGHQIGDKVLLYVVDRAKKNIRGNDKIARIGGDEFAIILEDIGSQENIKKVAQKICESVAEPIVFDGYLIQIGASIGISIYPTDCSDMKTLIKQADDAMYHAKQHGGSHFIFYKDIAS
jgi:diguanylate cyclase (GGDEF)-like protein